MRVPTTGRRRLSAAIAVASACAVTATQFVRETPLPVQAATAPARLAAPLDDDGYVAVATEIHRRLGTRWNARLRRYDPGSGASTSMVNGDLLLVHAVAAQRGLVGILRDDARARAIVRFLTGSEIYGEHPPAGADPQVTGPGWVNGPGRAGRHPVFDTEVIDGLVHAYLARDALGLAAADVARIRREVHRVATGSDYAWPALRLNQINWYCQMYAADAIVNGTRAALADGMGRQLERFLANAHGAGRAVGNLGPGLHFRYLPHMGPRAISNVDSAEYANIVLSFSRFYGLARRAGMQAPAQLGLLREWVRRVLSGYWTHGAAT